MTDIAAPAPAVVGRSLWGDAWARLKANRAAMFSLYYLAFIALISVFGPSLVPHEYTTIYGDYVRTPPSLSAYPKPDMIQT
ncbi:MAG: ABC transporter permease, partial [Mesorhizobium sp.]